MLTTSRMVQETDCTALGGRGGVEFKYRYAVARWAGLIRIAFGGRGNGRCCGARGVVPSDRAGTRSELMNKTFIGCELNTPRRAALPVKDRQPQARDLCSPSGRSWRHLSWGAQTSGLSQRTSRSGASQSARCPSRQHISKESLACRFACNRRSTRAALPIWKLGAQ
jgi:hypothetical protein